MCWSSLVSDANKPEIGSEGGAIILDEEHDNGARITLERDSRVAPFAITCGIYGWMVHTRYFSVEVDARRAFDEMRRDLEDILKCIPFETDPEKDRKMASVMRALSDFVDRHPT